MGKDDYLCVMQISMDNFDDPTIAHVHREQYGYRQEQQKQEEDDLRKAVITKQTGLINELILSMMRNSISRLANRRATGKDSNACRYSESSFDTLSQSIEFGWDLFIDSFIGLDSSLSLD